MRTRKGPRGQEINYDMFFPSAAKKVRKTQLKHSTVAMFWAVELHYRIWEQINMYPNRQWHARNIMLVMLLVMLEFVSIFFNETVGWHIQKLTVVDCKVRWCDAPLLVLPKPQPPQASRSILFGRLFKLWLLLFWMKSLKLWREAKPLLGSWQIQSSWNSCVPSPSAKLLVCGLKLKWRICMGQVQCGFSGSESSHPMGRTCTFLVCNNAQQLIHCKQLQKSNEAARHRSKFWHDSLSRTVRWRFVSLD